MINTSRSSETITPIQKHTEDVSASNIDTHMQQLKMARSLEVLLEYHAECESGLRYAEGRNYSGVQIKGLRSLLVNIENDIDVILRALSIHQRVPNYASLSLYVERSTNQLAEMINAIKSEEIRQRRIAERLTVLADQAIQSRQSRESCTDTRATGMNRYGKNDVQKQ